VIPALETVGVRKKFAGVVALDDLEIIIEEGEIHGLVGANGAGKTTILNVIGGQVTADSGFVRIAGQDVERLSPWRRAELGLGRTFQESRMWPDLTAAEHLRIAIDASRRIAGHASGNRALDDMCSVVELPKIMLDRMPAQMRLLDRRRVELAMAALNASNLLLIDEIGAGLDIEEARTLYRLVSQLIGRRRVRAAILVEHKLELLAAFATGISLIENGKVGQHADCKEAAQLAHLMNRMFDRRSGAAADGSQERRVLQ
jgi:ABC-type branched-subunit amino acid transport system ATPase component